MIERTGKVIAKVPNIELKTNGDLPKRVVRRLLETEMYLNDEVATYVFRRFGVGIRIHL